VQNCTINFHTYDFSVEWRVWSGLRVISLYTINFRKFPHAISGWSVGTSNLSVVLQSTIPIPTVDKIIQLIIEYYTYNRRVRLWFVVHIVTTDVLTPVSPSHSTYQRDIAQCQWVQVVTSTRLTVLNTCHSVPVTSSLTCSLSVPVVSHVVSVYQ
jgi:hypothetical protein